MIGGLGLVLVAGWWLVGGGCGVWGFLVCLGRVWGLVLAGLVGVVLVAGCAGVFLWCVRRSWCVGCIARICCFGCGVLGVFCVCLPLWLGAWRVRFLVLCLLGARVVVCSACVGFVRLARALLFECEIR